MPSAQICEYPSVLLKISRMAGSQVTELAQALAGTVNTTHLNLTAHQIGGSVFTAILNEFPV